MIATPDDARFFIPGDRVRVTDGYFESYKGVVESVDLANRRAVVVILVFERPNPVELEFQQIERLLESNE